MIRIALATLLTALLTVTPVAAQTTPDCTTGRARGAWDLPTRDQAGRVRGILGDGTGRRMVLEGRLTPMLLDNGQRGGRIDGVIVPLTADGIAQKPVAEVHGLWIVAPDRSGRFEAAMYPYEEGRTVLPDPIGKMAGAFADPMIDGNDTIGRFAGRWAMCR